MDTTAWPTFGRMLRYLTDRGFALDRDSHPGHVFAYYPSQPKRWFVFRDRPADDPARGIELVDLRSTLDQWGFVTFREFSQFWTEYGPRQPEAAPPEPAPAT